MQPPRRNSPALASRTFLRRRAVNDRHKRVGVATWAIFWLGKTRREPVRTSRIIGRVKSFSLTQQSRRSRDSRQAKLKTLIVFEDHSRNRFAVSRTQPHRRLSGIYPGDYCRSPKRFALWRLADISRNGMPDSAHSVEVEEVSHIRGLHVSWWIFGHAGQ